MKKEEKISNFATLKTNNGSLIETINNYLITLEKRSYIKYGYYSIVVNFNYIRYKKM
jgi:hypothetical protein